LVFHLSHLAPPGDMSSLLVHLTLPSFAATWPAVVVASATLAYLLAGSTGLQPAGSQDGRWLRRRAAGGG
jgi:hypothetical protein